MSEPDLTDQLIDIVTRLEAIEDELTPVRGMDPFRQPITAIRSDLADAVLEELID